MNEEIKSSLLRISPFIVILFVIGLRLKQKRLTTTELYLNKPISILSFLKWWMGFLIFILLTELTLYHFELLEVSPWNKTLWPSVIRIVGAVVLAPVAEELIFRGIFLNKLLEWKVNKHLAISILSLLFVAMHSFTYENTLSSNISIAQTFIDASLFSYARLYTNSLYTPMAMHATGNLIATLERFIL